MTHNGDVYVPPTKKEQVLHWIEQLEFQAGQMKKAYEEGRYGYVLQIFRLTASMVMNDALVDAAIVAKEEGQYED